MIKKLLIISASFLFVFNVHQIAIAKNYSIKQIRINAEILDDGSLLIEESRMYNFRGQFTWADYKLPLDGLGRVTDFSFSEGNTVYTLSKEKKPGTFYTLQKEDRFYLKWFYRASNEIRTFTLRYRVEDAVAVHDDVAVFYYKFIGSDNPKEVEQVDVWLKFPQPADTSTVRAWVHGPLNGMLAFEKTGFIRLTVRPLPKNIYWETRVMFPKEWVPKSSKILATAAKQNILLEEKTWAAKANALREQAARKSKFQKKNNKKALNYSIFLVLAGFLLMMYLYQRYGQPHRTQHRGAIFSEIPENLPPAIANYVFTSGQTNSSALVSTLLDLARRGFIKIEEKSKQNKILFWNSKSSTYTIRLLKDTFENQRKDLSAYELDMLGFIFSDLSEGFNEIEMKKLSASRSKFMKWFRRWKKIIKNSWGNRPLYDKMSIRGTIISVIVSSVITIAGIVMSFFWGNRGIIAIVGGLLLLMLSFFIMRYTKDVKSIIARLKGLRTYLTKYHFRNQPGLLQTNLEKYLVYGVALGIGIKPIKEMLKSFPDLQSAGIFPWYVSSTAYSSPDAFANAVSSMISTTGAAMSSASGTSGGASAGGGGGAGGASGGAG